MLKKRGERKIICKLTVRILVSNLQLLTGKTQNQLSYFKISSKILSGNKKVSQVERL